VRGYGARGYTLRPVETGGDRGAFRDERHSLAAENARLKAELAGLRGAQRSRMTTAALVALALVVDGLVFTAVVRWVNAPRDADVWLGWSAAALLLVANVVFALRVLRPARG